MKLRIVAESLLEPSRCSETARRHGISRSQLYEWRRLARAGKLGEVEGVDPVAGFIPAIVPTELIGGHSQTHHRQFACHIAAY
ncbi:transposase [Brucella intermedia]|uniref:transposase n=1 Tax=Brucella intermedia TaxID=94625 RepID=UPI003B638C00